MSVEGRSAEVVTVVAEGVVQNRLLGEGFRDNSNLDPRLGKSGEYESGLRGSQTFISRQQSWSAGLCQMLEIQS